MLLVLALVPALARAQEGPIYRWTGTGFERVAGTGASHSRRAGRVGVGGEHGW
jgi:hypothetical protein